MFLKYKRAIICTLSALISIMILFSCVVSPVTVGAAGEIEYASGSGRDTDPYIIKTAEQLRNCIGSFGGGHYYKLANDIYLNDIHSVNWKTGEAKDSYLPNVWFGTADPTVTSYTGLDGTNSTFSGYIDGNGFAVHGIYGTSFSDDYDITANGYYSTCGGLVPVIRTGEIKNLTVKNSYITSGRYLGAVCGYATRGVTLDKIVVDETVTLAGANAGIVNGETRKYSASAIGGLVGYCTSQNTNLTVTNCSFAGSIQNVGGGVGNEYGILGTYYKSTVNISDSFSVGFAPLISRNSSHSAARVVTVKNLYSTVEPSIWETDTGTVTGTVTVVSSVTGENALTNMDNLSKEIWYEVKGSTKAPMLRIYGTNIGDVDEDGIAPTTGDILALRSILLGADAAANADHNHDKTINVCDLVSVTVMRSGISVSQCNHSYLEHTDSFGNVTYTCAVCSDVYTETACEDIKILAIGNSFSVDGTEYLWDVLTDAGIENVTVGNLYIGGCTLNTHWTNISTDKEAYTYYKNTTGSWTETADYKVSTALLEEDWDIITVQQSSKYSGMPDYYNNLTNVLNYLNENKTNENAKIYWQLTWAYAGDYTADQFGLYDYDQLKMYNAIISTVQDTVLTNQLIDGVIPTGTTIQNMRTSYLGDNLDRDGLHLSYDFGRYAAALTWMSALTGIPADAVDWVPSAHGHLYDHVEMVTEAVKNAINTPYEITNSTYTVEPEITDATLMANNGLNIGNFTLADIEPTVGGYYDSSDGTDIITGTTLASKYVGTKVFDRNTLPNGSVIIVDTGYRYRPEGWIDGSTLNESTARPAQTSQTLTVVDDDWWGEYTLRAFNLNRNNQVMTEDDTTALRIYTPKS